MREARRSGAGPRLRRSGSARTSLGTTLPLQPGPLIGRDEEVATGARLLTQPQVRLLTLTGPPGIGKTRLALEMARRVEGAFADGAWFVDLAPVRDPAGVPAAIARALRLRHLPAPAPLDGLIDHLQDRAILLLLDNFEQVVAAAAQVAELLAACGRLTCLVTSRTALRVPWEHSFPVPPLSVPDLSGPEEASADPGGLASVPAVALFLERARALVPAFQLTGDNARAVAEICVRLDGLPLAIELAAARIPILTPQQIAARLGDRFRLLTGGSRSWPDRHRTLQAVVDWSYDLLSVEEQAVLRRLGVFVGAFTLEAAAEVVAGPPVRDDRVLDLIAALVDHSLLVVDAGRPAPYRLLETIRHYALARLADAGEAEAARDRHLACYLRAAERGAHGLEGPRDPTPVAAVAAQHDNVRAAMEWAQARDDLLGGVRLAVAAAGRIWAGHIHPAEARQWLEGWLHRANAGPQRESLPEELRARALYWAGELAWEVGDNARAVQALDESAAAFRRLGDNRGLASALNTLAVVWYRTGEYAAARRALGESLPIARALADAGLTAFALLIRGIVARLEGDYQGAEAWGRESLEVARTAHLTRAEALAVDSLGVLAAQRRDGEAAEALAQEALARFRSLGDAYGTVASLNTLALAALARGEAALARARSLESLPVAKRVAARGSAGRSLLTLARAALLEGDAPSALPHVRDALGLFAEVGERLGIVQSLEVLGTAALQAGEAAGARLLGAAAAARARLGAPPSPLEREVLDRVERAAEALLAPGALAAARAAGEGMGLEGAVEEGRRLARALVLPSAAAVRPRLRVRLLGGFEVWRGGQRLPPTAWRRRRDRHLFAYLLIAREPVLREAVLEALWPNLSPESARASLNVAWSNVKRALGADGAEDGVLRLERGRYGIRRGAVVTDVEEFDGHVAAAARARDPQAALAALEAAAGLYRGHLLPDEANEPWTLVERERLRLAHLTVLERLAEARAALGQVAEAEARLREVLRLDPWREEIYRRLMRLLAADGRRAEALRLYHECVAALRRELAVEPSRETVALFEAIASGQPSDHLR